MQVRSRRGLSAVVVAAVLMASFGGVVRAHLAKLVREGRVTTDGGERFAPAGPGQG